MQHFIPRRLQATCLTIPLVVVALCQCWQWAIDRWTRDSELVFIKNQSQHMYLSWTAHLCTTSFATGFSVHPIGCRDTFGMTRPSGWMPGRSSAATAGPDGRWTRAVCHPKIARGEGMNWDDLWSAIPQRLGRQRPRETGGADLA